MEIISANMDEEDSLTKDDEVNNLIAEVRKYKFLYDPLHQHYKNNALRTKVWDKITESLGSSKDRKKIMIKWKNLKKKFMDVKLQRPRLPAKNQQLFLDSMQFILPYYNAQALDESVEAISSDVFEPYPHERDTLRLVSEDIWFEDSFIDEIKKHPELYDSSLLSTSNADKKKIWADIAEIFQESDKKLMLKWKNLRRKYIMMRYPQSSKNSITGKRKIRYCQEFVDRLSFLDTYLNATIVGKDLLENTLAQEKAIIKEETTIEKDELKGDEIEYIEDSNSYNEPDQYLFDEDEIQEDIFLEGDDQGNDPQDRVQIIFESNDIEDLYEEVEEEDEGEPPQKKQRSDPGVSSQVLPTALNPSYDAIEFFCLSLAEPIRRMDFLNQQKAKEKIFAVINEQLSASFSK